MAMASDVEYKNIDGIDWSLPEYLDGHTGEGWGETTLWHITDIDNIQSIREHGLRTSGCGKWMSSGQDRPEAVYFFCAKSVLRDMAKALLDEGITPAVVEVVIPADQCHLLAADNFFNMSVEESYMTAVKFLGDVPASCIRRGWKY